MSFRKPFSKAREKVKLGFSKIGDKLERGGTNVGGKGFDRSALSQQPESASIMVEGKVRGEDNKAGEEDSTAPRLVVGRGDGLEEAGQSSPHLRPHVEIENEFGREGKGRAGALRPDFGDMTPTSSISRDGESGGM